MNKKIIYIVSDVRSGSTLLENILSHSPNIISVGELHHLDSHINRGKWGKSWNWSCSCGKSIEECIFWTKVLSNLKTHKINKIKNTSITPKKSKYNYFDFIASPKYNPIKNRKVLNIINTIYSAIFEEINTSVIVDSSKNPLQGLAIYQNSGINVKIIYLKRDIRAVTFSKAKWEKKIEGKHRNLYKLLISSKLYDVRLKKCLKKINKDDVIRITYKELSQSPQVAVDKIINKFELQRFIVPKYMDCENNHSIGGTPTRFNKSKIQYDDKWKEQSKKKPILNFIGKLVDKL